MKELMARGAGEFGDEGRDEGGRGWVEGVEGDRRRRGTRVDGGWVFWRVVCCKKLRAGFRGPLRGSRRPTIGGIWAYAAWGLESPPWTARLQILPFDNFQLHPRVSLGERKSRRGRRTVKRTDATLLGSSWGTMGEYSAVVDAKMTGRAFVPLGEERRGEHLRLRRLPCSPIRGVAPSSSPSLLAPDPPHLACGPPSHSPCSPAH